MKGTIEVRLTLNGEPRAERVDSRLLLVELIRGVLDAKGTRVGCLTGDCGACTVSIDGEVRKSCLVLAASISGNDVRTIEGIGGIGALQEAFIAENGFQCGFCTSGMIIAAADLLKRNALPSHEEIRRAISGNLCRCTGYESIVNAIYRAAHGRHACARSNVA
ncbi:2Fe-2S iron-sulfur cluster binding domain-containing protein [Caballeronia terrestris]|jgi:aerobic-type carbon monoxide dehydrogenase small subunit (CoxS/CutS family)|uniref:2Fe-2S iron-sulfur cluster binding domain-containing protein n=1 Tax=Caballeronia terrestris TaxID=1226301 RepID=A0A158L6Y5_9BURK|nr:(2Fe-2S)-binding protein [Caballeronia terrestris]SAL88783.1 2Fe-2S iron-sulfur cluster binding domain-containing protein [Caballeronia terrestris]